MHKDAVEGGLIRANCDQNPSRVKKYAWAAEYHNWTCSQLCPQDTDLPIVNGMFDRSPDDARVFRSFPS